jgi:hypothetical protein
MIFSENRYPLFGIMLDENGPERGHFHLSAATAGKAARACRQESELLPYSQG